MERTEREQLIQRYAGGPARLEEALARVPEPALTWRPAPDEWSAHEIVCHCADSETNAAARIRYLAVEPDPLIVGYDQAAWAVALDYHGHPLAPALAAVATTRANTAALLRRLPEAVWGRAGRHPESGRYTAQDWLRIYAAHLHDHADQIDRNVAVWRERNGQR